jgi:hypothetical protein
VDVVSEQVYGDRWGGLTRRAEGRGCDGDIAVPVSISLSLLCDSRQCCRLIVSLKMLRSRNPEAQESGKSTVIFVSDPESDPAKGNVQSTGEARVSQSLKSNKGDEETRAALPRLLNDTIANKKDRPWSSSVPIRTAETAIGRDKSGEE